jgi:two-component system, chemotaxis family, response regulator Rcp1
MRPLKSIEVLLVEDDPADIELTSEALKDSKMLVTLNVVGDGVNAMKFLNQESPYTDASRPDLVILDLNLPRMSGREVLQEIKNDENLRSIPVCILTTSKDALDIKKCYECGANCCITKPIGLKEFTRIVSSIQDFWFTVVKLPPQRRL